MGSFSERVRNEEIISPLRREFKKSRWNEGFEKYGEDAQDKSLHTAGLLILDKCSTIRSQLKFTSNNGVNATSKLRTLVGLANQNMAAISLQTHKEFERKAKEDPHIFAHELGATKLNIQTNTKFTPDELIQSLIDGVELPIKVVLSSEGNVKNEGPDFSRVDLNEAILDFNLGIIYRLSESLWDDCLWNDYRVDVERKLIKFTPFDLEMHKIQIVSESREMFLTMQFLTGCKMALNDPSRINLLKAIKIPRVSEIIKDGKNQILKTVQADSTDEVVSNLVIGRAYASEPYYSELLNERQTRLDGASVQQLLASWALVQSAVRLKYEEINKELTISEEKLIASFHQFCPIFQRKALVNSITKSLKVTFKQANLLIDFLTYSGEASQELWAQPLVPVSEGKLAPMFGSLIAPNLKRIIDVWLKQLGVDLGRRGPSFETYINEELKKMVLQSSLLKSIHVLPLGMRFRPVNGREEQIDTVIIFDDLIVLGESKCILRPTEAT